MDDNEDERVAEWYDALSPSYDELYSQEQSAKHNTVIRLMGSRRFGILVDVGCGSGTFLRGSQRFYDYAVGVDLSLNMVKAAKIKGSARSDLVLATSRMLPIRNNLADCVVSISAIKDDSRLAPILSELRRVCKRDGLLALSVFHEPGHDHSLAASYGVRSSRVTDRESVYLLDLSRTMEEI